MALQSETATKGLGCSSTKRGMTEEGDAIDSRAVRIATPPPAPERVRLDARSIAETNPNRRSKHNTRHSDGSRTGTLDTEPFESSLFRELHRPQRESTPSASPHRKRQRINGDRYAIFFPLRFQVTDNPAVSSQAGQARTCKPVLVFYMRTVRLPLRLGRRSAHLMVSFTFKRVCAIPFMVQIYEETDLS
jgi:hypothetical protein